MISTRGRYALRVMIDIAEHRHSAAYIRLNEIVARQGISEKYLESILAELTRENLLRGVRGKGGGYQLTKDPQAYTVGSILRVTEGSLSPVACLKKGTPPCEKSATCKTLPLWQGLDETIQTYLDSVTLADLLTENTLS